MNFTISRSMLRTLANELRDLAGQLWRMDYGLRTPFNVARQVACYFSF